MSTRPTSAFENVIRKAVTQTVQFDFGDEVEDGCYRPPMDFRDTKHDFVAYIDLPGIDEDELEFVWHEHVLCIGGTREFNHDAEDAEEFTQIERKFGPFVCRIPLNDTLDVTNATAKYKRGVLKLAMPKRVLSAKRVP